MPIEIKQMVVKSNVVQACAKDDETDGKSLPEAHKKELLDACKRLIQEALRDKKER